MKQGCSFERMGEVCCHACLSCQHSVDQEAAPSTFQQPNPLPLTHMHTHGHMHPYICKQCDTCTHTQARRQICTCTNIRPCAPLGSFAALHTQTATLQHPHVALRSPRQPLFPNSLSNRPPWQDMQAITSSTHRGEVAHSVHQGV